MAKIARLRITLDDVHPEVLRRLEVPLSIKLDRLHLVLQVAMPWENCHLFDFRAGETVWWPMDPDGIFDDGQLDVRKGTLKDMVQAANGNPVVYQYDFGDSWYHTIAIEVIEEAKPGVAYPRLLDAEGRCPPEDCGGPPGYEHYLEAMADPKHQDHKEMIRWRGPGFNPKTVDRPQLDKQFAKLAKLWTRKPRAKTAGGKKAAAAKKPTATRKTLPG